MDPRGHQGASVSGSSYITHWKVYTVTLTPASLATIIANEEVFAVPGVKLGDVIVGGGPQYDLTTAVMAGNMRVSADDSIAVSFVNPTAGALVPAAGVWNFYVIRFKDL